MDSIGKNRATQQGIDFAYQLGTMKLLQKLHRCFAWIMVLFRPKPFKPLTPAPAVKEDRQLAVSPEAEIRTRSLRYNEGESARWHFKATILDRLDEYFVCMRRLRRHDPDAYAFFRKVGLTVPADVYHNPSTADLREIKRITFGGVMLAKTKEETQCVPSFFYFTKVQHPVRVEQTTDTVYRLTFFYDNRNVQARWRSTMSIPLVCHVAIRLDGTARVLRESIPKTMSFTSGKAHRKTVVMSRREWARPSWLAQVNAALREAPSWNPDVWASEMLSIALHTHLSATERLIVRASRDGVTAAFGIDVTRCKYFFADRAVEALARDGKRKRIFHSVTAHKRQLPNFRVTSVRAHYRGIRHFTWNGAWIRIVWPENKALMFAAPMLEFNTEPPSDNFITLAEAATHFDDSLSQ